MELSSIAEESGESNTLSFLSNNVTRRFQNGNKHARRPKRPVYFQRSKSAIETASAYLLHQKQVNGVNYESIPVYHKVN